jgi:hypothetical protein
MMKKMNRPEKFIPWWLHLLFAVLCYGLLKYGVPQLIASGHFPPRLALPAEQASPIAAIIFLLLAANSLYSKDPPKDSSKDPKDSEKKKDDPGDQ